METIQQFLEKMICAIAVSGYEWAGPLPSIIQSFTPAKGVRIGDNLVFVVGRGKKKIVVSAHMDEVGFFITKVEKDFVRIMPIGGIDVATCIGKKLIFLGKNKSSITEKIRPAKTFASLKVRGLQNPRIGDVGTFEKKFTIKNDIITGPSLDNKVGCVALLITLNEYAAQKDKTIIFCFACREEVNTNGLMQAVKKFDPLLCIDIDSAYAQPMKSVQTKNWQIPRLTNGPAIQLMGNGFIIRSENRKIIENIATKYVIPFQYEIPDGENGGTNASTLTSNGYDAMQINIPVVNQHSAESTSSLVDIQTTIQLLKKLLESI